MPKPTRISLIVAMAQNHVIGLQNQLPWHIPADLRRFREITTGKPILMGRRTHESIGRALPGRTNIILTRNPEYRADQCLVVNQIDDALSLADSQELMVIGGEALYRDFLAIADRIYLTLIHRELNGDTFFPAFDRGQWQSTNRSEIFHDPASGLDYSFELLERAH